MNYLGIFRENEQVNTSLNERLMKIITLLHYRHSFICRVSISILKRDILKNFLIKDFQNSNIQFKSKCMDEETKKTWRSISIKKSSNSMNHEDNTYLLRIPLLIDGDLFGVVFLNSTNEDYINDHVLNDILFSIVSIKELLVNHFNKIQTFKLQLNSIFSMAKYRDPETSNHLIRLSKYSYHMAERLSNKNRIEYSKINPYLIGEYSSFHDIGKYKIPDDVLFSTEIFSDEDREIMNNHPQYGIEIIDATLKNIINLKEFDEDINILKNIILHHHERWDGNGYPHKLSAESIPIESRIVAICDVFDALISKRPYKNPWSLKETIDYISSQSKIMFDPNMVSILVENSEFFYSLYLPYKD